MILIKESDPRKLFSTRYGTLSFNLTTLELEFDVPIVYRGRWKKGDAISKDIVSKNEISYLLKEFKIKGFPYEVFDENTMKSLIDFMRE